jgi:hypothetical protein
MYMQVWGHLRFGALLRYASIALLFLVVGSGLYFQFGPEAISYVSGFGKNQDDALIISDLPAQHSATVLVTGDDWKKTLDLLAVAPEEGVATTSDYQSTVTDDLIAVFLKEKIAAQNSGSKVNPDDIVQKYFKGENYGPVVLSFSDDAFHVSNEVSSTQYAKDLQTIVLQLDKETTIQSAEILKQFRRSFNVADLQPFTELLPKYEYALSKLLTMKIPSEQLQLHKLVTESILNSVSQLRTITDNRGDVIKILYALSAYVQSYEEGASLGKQIMALR